MMISIDVEKAFNKIQHPFMITALKLVIEELYLNIIKAINDKPIPNIILNGEKLKLFPLKSGMRQGCPLSPLLFNIILELLDRAKTGRRNKRNANWKGSSHILPFTDGVISHIKDPKNSTKKQNARHYKKLQQSIKTQNQSTKISRFFEIPTMNRLRKDTG
jgi:hypothetical protein